MERGEVRQHLDYVVIGSSNCMLDTKVFVCEYMALTQEFRRLLVLDKCFTYKKK